MPTPAGLPRPTPTASWINARIRELMEQPRSELRTTEYRRLLTLWARTNEGVPGRQGPEFVTAA
ncbi:hypothetical protein ACFTUC_09950 [Streptomyces sp. NPDC056944]|uniref:hypothetical protein n=1 Tax=Streptomyces sp. NPDC056944 TaxID=3345972 RepID=UPI0036292399